MNELTELTASPIATVAPEHVKQVLGSEYFLFLRGAEFEGLLSEVGPWASSDAFERFASTWNDLKVDEYMADAGRYRRRRHGVFLADARGNLTAQAHRPHHQALEYNPLNGGIERWFAPLEAAVAQSPVLHTILSLCSRVFTDASDEKATWDVEVHQFRIEARPGTPGRPTPEGMHRDGVDHVLVLMIRRVNIASGTTTIRSVDDRLLDSFTLTEPLDAALLDDRRVVHGVTAVEPLDPSMPAFRDVLVVTYRRRIA